MANEIYHHGIKGMRWGVRRYQNEDGTLTKAGLRRYKKLSNNYKKSLAYEDKTEYLNRKLTLSGVTKNGKKDAIKSGSSIYRYADSGENIDHNRKYGSLTFDDRVRYSELASEGMIGVKNVLNMKLYEYEAAKDLQVANEKEVTDYIFSKYGNKKLRDIFDRKNELALSYKMDETASLHEMLSGKSDYFSEKDKKIIEGAEKMAFDSDYYEARKFIQKTFADSKTMNDISEHYKKLGYDAIVDIEDSGFADYPVIVLDPKESLRLKKVSSAY